MTTYEELDNMLYLTQEKDSQMAVGDITTVSYESYNELKLFCAFSLFETHKDVFVIRHKDITAEEKVQIECIKEIKWDRDRHDILNKYSFGKFLLAESPLVLSLDSFSKWEVGSHIPFFRPPKDVSEELVQHLYNGTKPSLWREVVLLMQLKGHRYKVKQVHKKGFFTGMTHKDVSSLSAYDKLKLANRLQAMDSSYTKKKDETPLNKKYKNLK